MERQPANAFEERLSRMTAALRSEAMPAAPADLLSRAPRARSARRLPKLVLGLCVGATALAVGTLILLPQPSVAAALDRMEKAQEGLPRHELSYTLQKDGTWKVTGEVYIDGTRFHMITPGDVAELYINGDKRYDIFQKEGYVIESRYQKRNGKGFFYPASLKRQLGFDHVKSVGIAGTAEWRGKKVTCYDVRSEFVDGRGQLLTSTGFIYADAANDRPYYEQFTVTGDKIGVYKDSNTGAMEWNYPTDAEANLVVSIPPGFKVYKPDEMREEVKEQVTATLGTDTVAGIKVTLRAVYLNSYGSIDVFTSGGMGRIERSPAGLRVDGKETDGAISGGINHSHAVDGTYVFDPLDYRGLKLIYQGGHLPKGFQAPDSFDLEVPVWKADHSPEGRSLAGYAKFRNVTPIRYEGRIFSDDQNRCVLWSGKDFEIERQFWQQLYGKDGRSKAAGK